MIVKIFSGSLSDYLGKRKLLAAIGYGLAAFTKPAFPLASSLGWLVAARFIDRIGKGIRGAPRDALIADLTPPDLRGAAFGLRQSLDTIGAVRRPARGARLHAAVCRQLHRRVLDRRRAGIFLVRAHRLRLSAIPIGLPAQRPMRNRRCRASELKRLGSAFWLVVGVATAFTLARFSEAFLLLRAQSVGLELALVPLVMVIMNIVYTLSAWPAGALSDRIGRYGLLAGGFAVLVACRRRARHRVRARCTLASAPPYGACTWG